MIERSITIECHSSYNVSIQVPFQILVVALEALLCQWESVNELYDTNIIWSKQLLYNSIIYGCNALCFFLSNSCMSIL